jgi:hypothetical protein
MQHLPERMRGLAAWRNESCRRLPAQHKGRSLSSLDGQRVETFQTEPHASNQQNRIRRGDTNEPESNSTGQINLNFFLPGMLRVRLEFVGFKLPAETGIPVSCILSSAHQENYSVASIRL